jgi:hypothetical protein
MQVLTRVDLREVVLVLLCNGVLRQHYKDVNKTEPSVQKITHHGWIHIVMVVLVARIFGPLLGLKVTEDLDEQSLVELGCLFHDGGLKHGRKRHAINGKPLVEEILAPMGVDALTIIIVRLLVRFHRADDFVWLATEILPRRQFILERLQEGDSLFDLVKTNDPDEDPNEEEVRQFLELMDQGIPMVRLLSALMVADLADIGRSRVRKERRQQFYKYYPEARSRKKVTLEDVLRSHQIRYSEFDLANFAITNMEIILQNDSAEKAASIAVQRTKRIYPRRTKNSHQQCWEGLFAWARHFAHLKDEAERRHALTVPLCCVSLSKERIRPTRLILRGVHDRDVCSPGKVEQIKSTYLAALAAAARLLGLEPLTEIRSTMDY